MFQFDMANGLTAKQLFAMPYGWTFDDVIIMPPFSDLDGKHQVSLNSYLTSHHRIYLHLPIVSSPMDTVTEHKTAIAMAQHGGLGIIHMNLPIDRAVQEVKSVKRYQMGIVQNPICRGPNDPISEVDVIRQQYGFSTVLITADGTTQGKLLGLVTKGHAALESDKSKPLSSCMIPRDQLMTVSAQEVNSLATAHDYLRAHPAAHKLPILYTNGSVAGFITRKDAEKMALHPLACINHQTGQLLVGAAVSTHPRDDERVEALFEAGVDVLLVDSAQGSTRHAVRRIKHIGIHNLAGPTVPIIAGNVVTPNQAKPLIEAGAHALRVGMGSGSICTTQTVQGFGRAQLSAIYHVSEFARQQSIPIPVIADGGIVRFGDIFKALACGASAVMVGRLIAGCNESPAKAEDHQGRRYRRYRGMGSPGAILDGGALRYGQDIDPRQIVPQGVEGLVPESGPLADTLRQVASALTSSFEATGCAGLHNLHTKVQEGDIRFELRSDSARQEGKPHDIIEI